MGRPNVTSRADPYWEDTKLVETCPDGKKQVTVTMSKCRFCGIKRRNLSGRKKVAHLCGIEKCNITTCDQKHKIPEDVIDNLLPTIMEGKKVLEKQILAVEGRINNNWATNPSKIT